MKTTNDASDVLNRINNAEVDGEGDGIVQLLARALGTTVDKLKGLVGAKTAAADPRNATCPACKNRYRIFPNYIGKQDVCPSCADVAFAPQRERQHNKELVHSRGELAKREAAEAAKRQSDDERIATIAAHAAEQVLAQSRVKKVAA